ncbi:MAG: alkaline phosphatase family protein [Acidimicrobiales bacterium]
MLEGLLEDWTEHDLPFYHGLARTFPVADHWFSSCLGPTFPNRRFLVAGTANGLIDDLPYEMFDHPPSGTTLDLLTRNGISWVAYHHVSNVKLRLKRLFGGVGLGLARRIASGASRVLPVLMSSVRGNLQCTADVYPLGLVGCIRHLRPIEAVLGRCPRRHPSGGQPRRSRLQRVLGGEPSGRPGRRELCREGRQRGDEGKAWSKPDGRAAASTG